LAGYRIDWAPERLALAANGCVEANLLMKIDRRVAGTVLDASDSPVQGVLIELISTEPKLERWEKPVLLDESDENGHYAIDGAPSGEYYLGVNIGFTPTHANKGSPVSPASITQTRPILSLRCRSG
jgi:hypothetical protein